MFLIQTRKRKSKDVQTNINMISDPWEIAMIRGQQTIDGMYPSIISLYKILNYK